MTSESRTTEAALVKQAQAGDRAAFGTLYRQYRPLVHGILLSHADYHLAEDLMQDTFVRALERLPALRESTTFGAWLITIARNTALDHHRKRKLFAITQDFAAIGRPDREGFAILDSIKALPETYRETLVLRLVEGFSGPEIAAQTGLTPDSVRVNLCRGIKNAPLTPRNRKSCMNEDYLWNRTGAPDLEIVHLEQLLAPLRHKSASRHRYYFILAPAALIVISLAASLFFHRAELTDWKLVIQGLPTVAVRKGQLIETPRGVQATLESNDVGEVNIESGARIRIANSAKSEQRFSLERGTIHAFIWAPPTQFVVDTPAARAVDLGCQYTLNVAPDGAGLLTVTMGWVAFESHGLESFIPAGAQCRIYKSSGAGTPYFTNASATFIESLQHFDQTGDPTSLDAIIAQARTEDALTLWHLLPRTQGSTRAKLFTAFAAKVRLPPDATQAAIIRGDQSALDSAWNALNLGEVAWWRIWKQSRPPTTAP